MFNVEYATISETGLVRRENQDRVLACFADAKEFTAETRSQQSGHKQGLDFFGALVADGVGGSFDGGKAASAIQSGFKDFWSQVYHSKKASRHDLMEAVLKVHQQLLQENDLQAQTSASTLVLLHITSNFACLMNVGDSRGYLLRSNNWEQLTTDDKVVGTNLVVSVLGPKMELKPHLVKYPIQEGDLFLICSDGLDGMLPPLELFPLLLSFPADTSLSTLAEKLYQAAMQKGGRDNCSFVLLKIVHIQEEPVMVKEEAPIPEKTSSFASEATEKLQSQWSYLLEAHQQQFSKILKNAFLEQESQFLILKNRIAQLETKIFYLLGIFGTLQLILLFVFLLIFRFLVK